MLLIVATAPSIGSLSGLWIWPGAFGSTIYAICKTLLYGIPAWVAWRTLTRRDLRNAFRSGCTRNALLVGTASGLLIGGGIVALWFGWLQSTCTSRRNTIPSDDSMSNGTLGLAAYHKSLPFIFYKR